MEAKGGAGGAATPNALARENECPSIFAQEAFTDAHCLRQMTGEETSMFSHSVTLSPLALSLRASAR